MRNIIILLLATFAMFACKSNNMAVPVDFHEVVAKESMNASAYTYVLVTENDKEQWIAVPQTEIKIGGTYYYQGGMEMINFESKELKRTFASVLFLEGLSDNKDKIIGQPVMPEMTKENENTHVNVNATNLKKIDITIQPSKGAISISELYAKKDNYSGKKAMITGQVTKFSAEIMNKNWVHIQDGSEYEGRFDLTITTNAKVTVGETVTFEGKIAINKDFGYGYAYEVLMEDAVVAK
jgi:hypothetical protein